MTDEDHEKMWEELLEADPDIAEGYELENKRRAEYRRPAYTLATVLDATGASETTVRNWLTRGRLDLDAEKSRAAGGQRKFSQRDAVVIALTYRLHSKVGMQVTDAVPLAELVLPLIDKMATSAVGVMGDQVLSLWKAGDNWKVAIVYDTSRGAASAEELELIALQVRPFQLLSRVFEALQAQDG